MENKSNIFKIGDFVSDKHDKTFTKAVFVRYATYDAIENGKLCSKRFCKIKVIESKFKNYIGQYLDILPDDLIKFIA